MRKKYFITLIILIQLLLLISCGGKTTDIESDNFGVLLNDTLYSTIQEAIDEAVNGDTIYLTEGIYADAGDKNLNWDGEEKHLTIKLHEYADYAIIECNGKGSGFVFYCSNLPLDIIDGITIRNAGKYDNAAISCNWVSPTIRNCTISDCDWCGIYCYNSAPIIKNNTIEFNEVGIMCDYNSNPTIKCNIIEGNKLDGIYAKNDSNPSIINNLIVHNKRGIYCWQAKAWIINNTIADNEMWGINVINDTPAEIINSIIWDNGKGFQTANINVEVRYSCAQDSFASLNPDSLWNIYKDPLFIFPGIDYHLPGISPCINAGDTTVVTWDYDLDGIQRVFDEKVDMGVYEWQP